MTLSRIAVVVIDHNAGDDLVACIASVRSQAPADVLVIDNGSTDGSAQTLDPAIRVLTNDRNVGFAAAANQGVRATSAPYVMLLNQDATLEPGALAALEHALDERPAAGAVGALVRNPDGTVQPTRRRFPSIGESILHGIVGIFRPDNPGTRAYTLSDADLSRLTRVDWVAGTTMTVRREAFDAVGGFDERFFFFVEDVDLCKRLANAGYEVLFQPEAVAVHAWGGSWTKRPLRFLWMHQRNLFRYATKHYRGAWVLVYPFIGVGLILRFVLLALRWLITRRSVPKHRWVRGST